jgi:MFS superfamily sulfate permease-like transporter
MGGKIYGFFFYNFGISSLTVLLVTLFLTNVVGYLPVFLLCSCLTVVSFVLMLRFKEESLWKKDEKLLDELTNS